MNWEDFDPKRKLVATYGRFTVYHDPLVHLPWGLYRVYSGSRYVAGQISFPSKSDCEWLARGSVYAVASAGYERFGGGQTYKRGATSPAYIKWRKEKRAA